MKKTLLLILALFCCGAVMAQTTDTTQKPELPLSDDAYISVITCGAGNEFYSTFGHSAIHICDTARGIDYVYNYGTFDFDTPHFYWNFAKGRLNYRLARATYDNFMWEYGMEGRSVWEQKLRLTQQEKCNLYLAIETNLLPEYRYYLYDFFLDNCATRVRDMVINSLDHRTLFVESTSDTSKSYRQLLYPPMEQKLEWWRLGIDLVLGQRCDHRCSNMEYMFSPFEMMIQFDTTCVSDTHQPLAEPAVQLLEESRTPLADSVSPTLCFWFLFVVMLCLTIIGWAKEWKLGWMDAILFGVAALLSLFILFMWLGTEHYCTKVNWNILWASPLFIYFAIRLRKSHRVVIYIQLALLVATLVICLVGAPQGFNAAIFPIALSLAVRLIANLRHRAIIKKQ